MKNIPDSVRGGGQMAEGRKVIKLNYETKMRRNGRLRQATVPIICATFAAGFTAFVGFVGYRASAGEVGDTASAFWLVAIIGVMVFGFSVGIAIRDWRSVR